ncbi:MAG TPA: hypothetical protein VHG32_13475 [Thermoanaerobaculia bacterium]|jgi:hypothetical protein|nr:hypothetical protein [Thermoanaerobaculia bacterium]
MENPVRLLVIASLVVLASVSARADRIADSRQVATPAVGCPAPATPPATLAADQAATSAPVPELSALLPGRDADRPFMPKPVPFTNGYCCDPTNLKWCVFEPQQACLNGSGWWTLSYSVCAARCPMS